MKQNTRKTLKFFLKHILKYKWLTAAMLVFLAISVFTQMYWPILVRDFFNALSGPGARDTIVPTLLTILVYLVLVDVIGWIAWRAFEYSNVYFQAGIMRNIMNECFHYLHRHSYNFFTNNFAGGLVKKVSRMSRAFEGIADKVEFELYPMALKIIIAIVVLSMVKPILGIMIFVWTIIFMALNYFLSIYKLKFDITRSKADTWVTATLSDTITNSFNVKLFSALKYELKRFHEVTENWFFRTKKAWNITNHINAIQAIFMIVLEFTTLYVAILLWRDDLITVGDFFLIQIYLLELFNQLWRFGQSIRKVYESLADAEEMTIILNTPHKIKDVKNARKISVPSGRVEFKNVHFSYGEGEESVLKGLNFNIKPGEKIALIGPSGGGKSTIVKLILRLYDIKKGQILIDGQNIAKVTQESLRENIALVPQDPILFHRTLMENIRYGRRDATKEEVIAASKMAHCHEFIEKFEKGYSTFVGERGVKLSGGQRQRVAIARAILTNARILILDEATSSLDSESETLIQKALQNLIKNKTTFIVAHRLSTVMLSDRIFVLKEGEIIEEGQHADLVNKKGGLYEKLWNLQVGGYL